MIRVFIYLSVMITLATLVAWLASAPGDVSILWQDYRVDTSAAFLLLLVLLGAVLLTSTYLLLRFLLRAPQLYRRRRQHFRYARGLQAVTQALAAIGASEGARAKLLNKRAEKYLGDAPIIHLLNAQLGKLEQDEGRIRHALEAMLEHRDTKALAARSLAEYNARLGNLPEAQKLALQAREMEPRNPQACRTLFNVYLQGQEWQKAESILQRCTWQRLLKRATAKRWRGLLYLSRAQLFVKNAEASAALASAEQAYRLLPDFAPAALLLARLLNAAGDTHKALSLLKSAWKLSPHPLLTDYLTELAAARPAPEMLKYARKLAAMHPAHPESSVLVARIAMQAREWNVARDTLTGLTHHAEQSRALYALAEVEQNGFQDSEAAANWRVKAASAPLEERWVCGSCTHQPEPWQASCPSCGAFDSLEWKSPAAAAPPALQAQA